MYDINPTPKTYDTLVSSPLTGKNGFSTPIPAWRILGFSLFLLIVLQIRIAPPDLAFYYSFAHSLVYDADLCFANEYNRFYFAAHELYLTREGLPANDWPMGTGVAWIPFLVVARMIRLLAVLIGFAAADPGWGWFERWVITFGATMLYGGGTLWLTHRYCLRERISTPSTLWAVFLMAIGSSYSYHLFVNSADSHPPSAFFILLFLYCMQDNRERPTRLRMFWAGASLGMAGLIRPHNLLFILTPILERWTRPQSTPSRTISIPWLFLSIGVFLAFFPQLLVWKTLYGSWLAIPRSEDVLWLQPELYNTLFSDYHGMISWSPLFGLGILGLCLRKSWISYLIPIALMIYIYSCNIAWWCGGSFGNRRMVCCAPLFILGLAALLDTIPKQWLKGVAILSALWTLSLLLAEIGGFIRLDRYQSWKEIFSAIHAGWLPGWKALLTGAEWGDRTLARLAGYLSTLALIGIGYYAYQKLRNSSPRFLASLAAIPILFFNFYCTAAALRTGPAAQKADLSQYISHDRFAWVVYYEKGFYLLGQKRLDEGLESMLTAALLEPRHPEPWMYMAYVSWDILGWDRLSYLLSSQALFRGKRTEEFLRFFERLLTERIETGAISPETGYNQRGVIRGARGNMLEAEEDFRNALAIRSDYNAAARNLAILENRRKGKQEPFIWE